MLNFPRKYLLPLLLALASCSGDVFRPGDGGPVEVGFYAGRDGGVSIGTRSVAGADGLSTSWEAGDALALWAYDSGGNAVIEGTRFSVYGSDASRGFFTGTIGGKMPEGSYRYFASYPVPERIVGSTAYFTVPSDQDGRSGGGEDVMVSGQVDAGPLRPVDWESYGHEELHLAMDHILHRMRFYTTSDLFQGEPVRRIKATFPKAVAGTIGVDLQDPLSEPSLTDGTNALDIVPDVPVAVSSGADRHYVTASIVPATFADGESMNVRVYTFSYVASVDIPLQSRTFAAGHSTPVNILPTALSDYYHLKLNLLSNNLGEDPQTVTLQAPSGCALNDAGDGSVVLQYGSDIALGLEGDLDFEDESIFRALGGKDLTVTYESEHVIISETVTVPDLSSVKSASVGLNVPYLLYEDFSGVPGFNSNDEYETSSTGSKDAYSFLNGWSGGRIGASAGSMVRLACRRESGLWVDVQYDSRMESAPMAKIKSPVNLQVSFDYGGNVQGLSNDDKLGQTVNVGYVTSTQAYKSGSEDGTYASSFHISTADYTGDWMTPYSKTIIVPSVPAGETIRVSWKTHVDGRSAFAGNSTAWLYLDNVKVTISNK